MSASLVTKLATKGWKEANFKSDVYATHIRTFFLPSKHVRTDIQCHHGACKIRESLSLDQSVLHSSLPSSDQLHPFVFCYTCNRVYHIRCAGFDLDSFKKQKAPFLCINCKAEPLNAVAVAYYESADWGSGVEKRRSDFLKSDSLKKCPNLTHEQLTDDEFEEDDINSFRAIEHFVNASFSGVPIDEFNQQKEELKKMSEIYQSFVKATEEREKQFAAEMLAMKNELQKLRLSGTAQPRSTNFMSSTLAPIANSRKHTVLTAESLLRKTYVENQKEGDSYTQTAPNQNNNSTVNRSSASSEEIDKLMETPDITLSDRVSLITTKAQIENSQAQRRMSNAMTLELKRKALPKISTYRGDAKNWIKFKKEIQRYKDTGCFQDDIIKMYILGALEGTALKRVQDMIDMSSLDELMNILETSFGHSPSIIKACEDDIMKYKLKGELMRNDVVEVNSLIQTYFTACRYANVPYLNSNMLACHILNQLSGVHKLFFRQFYNTERPNEITQIPDLKVLFSFLESIGKDLEVRSDDKEVEKKHKPAQLNIVATGTAYNYSNESRNRNDFKFEIKNKVVAPYIGYDIDLVNALAKKCECCENDGHFTIECNDFKSMNDKQRVDLIATKMLCHSCLLTSQHQAHECAIKLCCGFKIGPNRCAQKHHILLHHTINNQQNNNNSDWRGKNRRSNINQNASRANEIISKSHSVAPDHSDEKQNITNLSQHVDTAITRSHDMNKSASAASPQSSMPKSVNFNSANGIHNTSPLSYVVTPRQTNVILQNDRSVKVFKHFIYGPQTQTVGYSIGDSGAEITLMREDLRVQLGITGEQTTIDLQWTDGFVKSTPAVKVTLELKGISNDAHTIVLKNCFAVKDLNLPPRSLNVERLKKQFPYLSDVEFESYENAIPVLLIGSPHASCFEAIEPIVENGEGKPIAIKSKLGWSIFGGEPESFPETPCDLENALSIHSFVNHNRLKNDTKFVIFLDSHLAQKSNKMSSKRRERSRIRLDEFINRKKSGKAYSSSSQLMTSKLAVSQSMAQPMRNMTHASQSRQSVKPQSMNRGIIFDHRQDDFAVNLRYYQCRHRRFDEDIESQHPFNAAAGLNRAGLKQSSGHQL